MTKRWLAAAVCAALLTAAACSGDDDNGADRNGSVETGETVDTVVDDTDTGEPVRFGSGDAWSIEAALHEVPDDGADAFDLYLGDIAAVAELLDLDRPSSVADVDAVLNAWLLPLTFPGEREDRELPVWLLMNPPVVPRRLDSLGVFEAQLGWSVVDVDAYVDYVAPPTAYTVVAGTFDDRALAGLDEVADGIVTTHDAEDFEVDIARAGEGIDELGRAVRLGRDGDRIALSTSTSMVANWLDDDAATLADDDELVAIARALDHAGVLAAVLFHNDFRFSPDSFGRPLTSEQIEEQRERLSIEERFGVLGVGWGIDDDGDVRVVIAYGTAGDQAAATLVDQVTAVFEEGVSIVNHRPIREILGVRDLEVAADGDAAVVTYRPSDAFWSAAVQGVITRDTPFVWS